MTLGVFVRSLHMPSPRAKPVIMVVDDSRSILLTAQNFLKDDFEVATVKNGFSALAAVQDHHPDLLFLDVMMPELDGYSTCLAIKDNPQFADLPIIILSSKDSPFDKAHGRQMGCDDYLTKPFSEEELRDKIRQHLRRP